MFDPSVPEPTSLSPPQVRRPYARVGCGNHAENVGKVRRYLARLRKRKQGLPARRKGGAISIMQIARDENIPFIALRGKRVQEL